MVKIGKKKTIGSIVVFAAVTTAAIGISLSSAEDSNFVGYGTRGDTTIAFAVTDSAFIKDSMLLLEKKKGLDTVLVLTHLSNAKAIAADSTVLSSDTLTHVRVVRKK